MKPARMPARERTDNPPVGLVTPETDRDAGGKRYEHDPHPDPQLFRAGKVEHTSFEVSTVSLRVHERIEPRAIVEAVRRRNGAEPPPNSSGVRVFVDRDPVFPHPLPARSAKAPTTRLPKSPYMSMAMAITLAVLLGGCGGGGASPDPSLPNIPGSSEDSSPSSPPADPDPSEAPSPSSPPADLDPSEDSSPPSPPVDPAPPSPPVDTAPPSPPVDTDPPSPPVDPAPPSPPVDPDPPSPPVDPDPPSPPVDPAPPSPPVDPAPPSPPVGPDPPSPPVDPAPPSPPVDPDPPSPPVDPAPPSPPVGPDPPSPPVDTDPPVTPPPSPDLLREEYGRQGGLHFIHAAAMHERGGTGDGIVVALFDTGSSTHPELSGKYVYESKIDIDCSTVVPGQTCTPVVVDAADKHGHGTFLAGLIVAPRDGEGIVGVAYEAKLASVAISPGDVTEGQYPSWLTGLVPQIDKMIELGALVTNNSWGTPIRVVEPGPSFPASEVRKLMPIDKYQEYVDAGGVQVWASGNDQSTVPLLEGVAPWYFPDLEKGWLLVGAVNLDGGTASWYSNRCGLAADWCLVAPAGIGINPFNSEAEYEGLTSLDLNEGYRERAGTSVAAPLVAGAIASLKSMFPNLSYHQIRDRILATADKGVYDFYPNLPGWIKGLGGHPYIYGQGLLDLDAASSPVGGTSIPMTGSAYGSVVATRSTGANLPAAAVDRYFAGRTLLVLDSFQRAPFRIVADAFAERHGPLLAMSDLRLGMAERDGSGKAGYSTVGFGGTDFRNGGDPDGRARGVLGSGARVIEGMNTFTGIDGPSDGLYRMANDAVGLAVRVASGAAGEMFAGFAANVTSERVGARTFGAAGWAPQAVAALTFVGQDARDSVGLLAAPSLKRPMGWDGAGAFALSGGAYEMSYTREIASGRRYRLGFAGRLVHLETEAGPLLRFDDATMATAEVSLSLALGQRTTLTAGLGMERALTPAMGRLRLPSTIDESGRLGFEEVEVDGSEFLSLDRGTLNLRYTPTEGMSFGAGLTVVRDGFDDSQAIAGLQANIAF